MRASWRKLASWSFGIGLLVTTIWIIGGIDAESTFNLLSVQVIGAWAFLTLLIRLLQVEILVRPVHALGGSISRWQAFWLGWARTFLNQVIPMSGLAYFAAVMRYRSGMEWTRVAALAYPLFLLAVIASSLFGLVITPLALAMDHSLHWAVFGLFLALLTLGILLVLGGHRFLAITAHHLPRLHTGQEALMALHSNTRLVPLLLGLQILGVILRAARLYVLFVPLVDHASVITTAFLTALGELGFLIQITPGGIGIREGAMTAAAMLEGAALDVTLTISVADRVLVLLMTALAAVPAFWYLRSNVAFTSQSAGSPRPPS